jgi:hypothetical protein
MTETELAQMYEAWAATVEGELEQLRAVLPATLERNHDGDYIILNHLVHLAADFRQMALLAKARQARARARAAQTASPAPAGQEQTL